MQRPTSLLVAAAALVSWLAFCLLYYPPRIENALLAATVDALEGAGLSAVQPRIDGRDVVLAGSVESADSRARAERVVARVAGVLKVKNRMEVDAPDPEPLPPRLEIRSRPEGVILRGTVPSAARRDELLARAWELYGADRVDARLAVDSGVDDGAAVAAAGDVLAVLAGTRQTVQARLDGDSLRLSGTVGSVEARRSIEERARAAAPRVRLFFSALAVAEPPPAADSNPGEETRPKRAAPAEGEGEE